MSTVAAAPAMSVLEYYAQPAVRDRIGEYFGAEGAAPPTAAFVSVLSPTDSRPIMWERAARLPADQLGILLDTAPDVARSLWDSSHLIVALDFDYENGDDAASPFRHPADAYLKLEPVYRAAIATCRRYGLPLRALMTGRGYHLAGQIALADPLVDRLAAVVPGVPAWFDGVEARRPTGVTAPLTERQARAATGLGCIVEFLAHAIHRRTRGGLVPVVFNGTAVGPTGVGGREAVSIDFSYAGDPLDVRHTRAMFGAYQWHRLRPDIFGDEIAADVAAMAAIPRDARPLLPLLARGRALGPASRLARRQHAGLPDVAAGLARLLAAYESSALAAFHRTYYAALTAAPVPRSRDASRIPPCVARVLDEPNDFLLKPEHLQHVVRALLSRGWSAAQIARLVESIYEADHHWGDRWVARMQPRTRAEFEVRVFAGLVATGLDQLVDFNCVSAQEKQLCPRAECHYDLRLDRDRLEARRA